MTICRPARPTPSWNSFSIEQGPGLHPARPQAGAAEEPGPAVLRVALEPARLDEDHRHDDRRRSAAAVVSGLRGVLREFIQAYEAEGIPIHAVTVQNEPGVDRAKEKDPKWFYPSCHWTGEQERDFIRDHLGPALRRSLKTKSGVTTITTIRAAGTIPAFAYPRTILSDPERRAVRRAAWRSTVTRATRPA